MKKKIELRILFLYTVFFVLILHQFSCQVHLYKHSYVFNHLTIYGEYMGYVWEIWQVNKSEYFYLQINLVVFSLERIFKGETYNFSILLSRIHKLRVKNYKNEIKNWNQVQNFPFFPLWRRLIEWLMESTLHTHIRGVQILEKIWIQWNLFN